MTRILWVAIFCIIFLILDWYIFNGLKEITKKLQPTTQKVITLAYWAIPILSVLIIVFAFFVFPERISFKYKNFLVSFILIIYVSKVFAGVILLLGDILKIGKIALKKVFELFLADKVDVDLNKSNQTITRSEFITKIALTVGGLHIGAMSWGILSGAHDYKLRNIKLKLPNLPKKFEGLKIAQISDIHSGSFFNKTAVKGGVEMLLNAQPDVVFFTGDLVNNEAKEFQDYFNVFKKIKAPLGVYSTLGNHDYGDYVPWPTEKAKIQNLEDLKEAHRLMNWQLLMDEHKKITVDGESIGILGIQNWGVGFAQHGNLAKAMTNTEDLPIKLLLSHDPSHWRAQVLNQTDIDASFAGHTHGMQYGVEIGDIKWSPAQLRYKEWAGLYEENNQKLYVNRGYGYLGYPGRVGILPEITIFELVKA